MEYSTNINLIINSDTVLFFDMDGTLIDTDFANFSSYQEAIQSVMESETKIQYVPNERFNRTTLNNIVTNLTEEKLVEIIKQKEINYSKYLTQTKLNKSVYDILIRYCKTNKTVLVTNCRKDRALSTLNHFGLTDIFSKIFYREFDDNDKKVNKFQNAISKLNIQPNLIVAFENEETEIADAIQAGIKIINPINCLKK